MRVIENQKILSRKDNHIKAHQEWMASQLDAIEDHLAWTNAYFKKTLLSHVEARERILRTTLDLGKDESEDYVSKSGED